MKRRNFIRSLAGITGSLSLAPIWGNAAALELEENLNRVLANTPISAASDEAFWAQIREAYTVLGTSHINLNNGAVSPQPRAVEQALFEHTRSANAGPSYFKNRMERHADEILRANLAELGKCSHDEISLVRNTTEALENVIFGLPLVKGDEVVIADLDYPSMKNSFYQRQDREGIVVHEIELPLPAVSAGEYVKLYEQAITDKTKVILLTHIIHHTGQIMPVKEIISMAHSKGVEVILDGAHSFAALDFSLHDLDCDYFGTSLHKWLCAPYGTGMLYIKKEKIAKIWPLFGAGDKAKSDRIEKFENIGTRNSPALVAINSAIEFHNSIGIERKAERLTYLKNYWADKIADIPGLKFTVDPKETGAIAHFSIAGVDHQKLFGTLFHEHKVYTMRYQYNERIDGIRVSPHLFTSLEELDQFAKYTRMIVEEM